MVPSRYSQVHELDKGHRRGLRPPCQHVSADQLGLHLGAHLSRTTRRRGGGKEGGGVEPLAGIPQALKRQ